MPPHNNRIIINHIMAPHSGSRVNEVEVRIFLFLQTKKRLIGIINLLASLLPYIDGFGIN